MKASDLIKKARVGLILSHPFFGSLCLKLEMVEDPSIKTACTNGRFIRYNPKFVESLSLEEVKALIIHEVMHVSNCHHLRMQNREHGRFNQAADYSINPFVNDCGFKLPNGALLNPAWNGKAVEEIYNLLPEQQGKSGEGEGEGGFGEVEAATNDDGSPLSEAQKAMAEQEVKIAVNQAAQQAKSMGNMPAALKRLVDEILSPKIDWKDVLRSFVNKAAKNNYQWFPPNKRYISQGLYLPSLRSMELGELVLAVDTSGSISSKELNEFAAELTGILEEFDAELTVIYCDAKVNHVETFHREDLPLQLSPVGGGGTDFEPSYRYVRENGLDPVAFIYFSDGYGTFPKETPDYPVLWIINNDDIKDAEFPFGQVLRLH